ncbi:MAG: S4 domain-containing protein [Xanthobacteraceae bacterium]
MPPDRQRIDKWLWHARVARTRTAAATLAASGHVRVNGMRIDAPSRAVKAGDVITVALDSRVRILKVLGFAPRRGSADAAAQLFDEQPAESPAPSQPPAPGPAIRPQKPGRPTKRDRRAMLRFTGGEEP